MEDLLLALSEKNVKKLLKNKPVQLKSTQIGRGIKIHPDMPMRHKKALMKALKHQKGMRMQFDPSELISGSGFFDWLSKAFEPVKNMFMSVAKPIAKIGKPLIKTFAEPIAGVLSAKTGLPISGDLVSKTADLTTGLVGEGVKKRGGALKTNKTRAVSDLSGIRSDSSTLLSTAHPIFQTNQRPVAPGDMYNALKMMKGSGVNYSENPKDFHSVDPLIIKPNYTYGGSFLPSGYKSKGGKIVPKRGGSFKSSGY